LSTLDIYKSSAGSGKTYTLTLNWLKLLFQDESSYRRILAVTFTNKAAAEMKGRILESLYSLYKGNENAVKLTLQLSKSTGLSPEAIHEKAGKILLHILNNYSAFYVETIDKFFQWVIRNFARETGLQAGYNLELNNNKILAEAIDLLLFSLDKDENMRKWLVRFAEEKINEGRDWNFNLELLELGKEIFKEKYQEITGNWKNVLLQKEKLDTYINILYAEVAKFENYMSERGNLALHHIRNAGLSLDDFNYKNAGVAGYFKKIADKTDFDPKIRSRNVLNGLERWINKNSLQAGLVESLVSKHLYYLLEEALTYYDSNIITYNTATLILKNIYSFGVLADIYLKIREISTEKNIFLLSDATVFLKKITGNNDAPFVFEKAGNSFFNFMLDEFQDTSDYQWHNFYPLILNGLSSNHKSLIVGDVKQSIYRWRNSNWEILASQAENSFAEFKPQITPLDTNWRSLKSIVAFNNSLFHCIIKYLSGKIEEELSEIFFDEQLSDYWKHTIENIFVNSAQKVSPEKQNPPGYVEMTFYEKPNDEYLETLANELPELISDIQSRGYKPGDIAILVRKASQGREIASILMQYANKHNESYKFNVISNDSLFVENHPSVRFLIAVLHYINNPTDLINIAFIRNEFLRYLTVSDNGSHLNKIFEDCDKGITPGLHGSFDIFIHELDKIKHLSLFDLTEEIICRFRLNLDKKNIAFIQAFQDIVMGFINEETSDVNAFLEWWEEEGKFQTLNVSEAQDAIRILTIHKAKGLQFPVIIVPFCDWDMDVEIASGNYLWCKNNTEPFNMLEYVPVKYNKQLVNTCFRNEYFNERFHNYIDNLNLLYVALTRPMEELYVFADRKDRSSVAEFIHNAVLKAEKVTGEEEGYPFSQLDLIKENENEKFITGVKSRSSDKPLQIIPEFIEEYAIINNREKLKLNTRNVWLDVQEKDIKGKLGYGTLMHEIFAEIETAKDTEKAVNKAFMKGKISIEEIDKLKEFIYKRLNEIQVRTWFDGSWEIKKEREICESGSGFYRPDRVMIKDNEVIIVDYKFGEEILSRYENQIRNYTRILKNMGYSGVKAFLWYVGKNDPKEVI